MGALGRCAEEPEPGSLLTGGGAQERACLPGGGVWKWKWGQGYGGGAGLTRAQFPPGGTRVSPGFALEPRGGETREEEEEDEKEEEEEEGAGALRGGASAGRGGDVEVVRGT